MSDYYFAKTLVIDLETSIKNVEEAVEGRKPKPRIGNNRASPHWEDNKIVMWGGYIYASGSYVSRRSTPLLPAAAVSNGDLRIVGHNVKFDMLYLLTRDPWVLEKWDRGEISIWDTQQAEYLLKGQQAIFPSLDQCCIDRGWEVKDDRIKEFWDNGIDTEDIPPHMLADYLKHDVMSTKRLYEDQLSSMSAVQLQHAEVQMRAICATIEMELNGMAFDRDKALKDADRLADDLLKMGNTLNTMMNDEPHPIQLQHSSNQHVGCYLFGGDIQYTGTETVLDEDGHPVVYKSGKKKGEIKTRQCKLTYTLEGLYEGRDDWRNKTGWRVDDEVLSIINTPFTTLLLEYRRLRKEIVTYYIGYSELVWPDGMLHGNIHHCSTVTGRLSSANPNLQNVVNSTED